MRSLFKTASVWISMRSAPRDERALALALTKLLENRDLRERLGAAAASRAATQFSLAALREGTMEVYRRVLEPRA